MRYIRHCRRIAPYIKFYKQQIDYYNQTAYNILQNEIGLILPSFNNNNSRRKRFLTTILGTTASKVIGLAFEGISSFLHHKRHKALQKAVNVINSKTEIDYNRVYHLEDTMIMYGKYNSDTLMELVKTVCQMQNVTTWKENIFVSEMNKLHKNKLAHIHYEFDYSIDAVLFLTTIKEKYVRMYEKFIAELKSYLKAIRILSKGYLPITLITPSKSEAILKQVQIAIAKTNQDYEQVLNRLYLYYDMKLVMFGIDSQKNLIIHFPVFVQPYRQTKLTLYQIETVPVPILDGSNNNKIQSYTQLKIEKPYTALNDETYISICSQELNTCKSIGYEYFCEELFVVKSKHKHSCASTVYFNSNQDIKENCDFYFYHKSDVTSSVLDGGRQIILANWPNYKIIICTYNDNIPVNIPSHPYVLLDRNILCNCDIEAESNFLLESLAACREHEKPDLEMYFTVILAFVDCLEELNETIKTCINRNWTSFKQSLPVSLESFRLNSKLLHAPVMLRDFIDQYQENRITTTKQESPTSKFRSFINSFLIDMLVFIVAILTVFILFVIIYIIMGQSKLKVLVATLALQRVRAVEALNTNRQTQNCNSELLKILMILNLVIVVSLL